MSFYIPLPGHDHVPCRHNVPSVESKSYCLKSDCKNKDAITQLSQDVEKGERGASTHVSINISGMTCASCGKKGINTLNHISGVTHPQINFITSSGKFDVGFNSDVDQIINQFEHETGFKCTWIMRENQELEVIMSESEAQQLRAQMPNC